MPIFADRAKLHIAVSAHNMQASIVDKFFLVSCESTDISSKPGCLIKANTIEESIDSSFLVAFDLHSLIPVTLLILRCICFTLIGSQIQLTVPVLYP